MTYAERSSLQKRGRIVLAGFVSISLFLSCSGPSPSVQTTQTEPYALTHFAQEITSSTTQLALSINQSVQVPVTIKNPSSDTWFAKGNFPVQVSFKWFSNGQMLPIEGDRTPLAVPQVRPNESVKEDVRVVAPTAPGNYELQITLVQEGVAWFNLAGAKPLAVPTVVH